MRNNNCRLCGLLTDNQITESQYLGRIKMSKWLEVNKIATNVPERWFKEHRSHIQEYLEENPEEELNQDLTLFTETYNAKTDETATVDELVSAYDYKAPEGATGVTLTVNAEGKITKSWPRIKLTNRPIELPEGFVNDRLKELRESSFALPNIEPVKQSIGHRVVAIADQQFGKPGTWEALENTKRTFKAQMDFIRLKQAMGVGPKSLTLVWTGDETEGVANNYFNQSYLLELNQSEQLELDFDTRVWCIRQAQLLNIPLKCISVPSNHGEWTRNGGKDPVTTKYDNASTHMARQVKKFFAEIAQFDGRHISWDIANNSPAVVKDIGGTFNYFSHGYMEKGRGASTELRAKNALDRQILANPLFLGKVKVFTIGHYHHEYMLTWEGKRLIGLPALEAQGSSEYMMQFGVWSEPGMTGYTTGSDVNDFTDYLVAA